MGSINANENYKDMPDSKTALRVFEGGNFLSGIDFDDIQVTYPTATTELYAYYLSAVLQTSILVTYSTAAKDFLTRVQKV